MELATIKARGKDGEIYTVNAHSYDESFFTPVEVVEVKDEEPVGEFTELLRGSISVVMDAAQSMDAATITRLLDQEAREAHRKGLMKKLIELRDSKDLEDYEEVPEEPTPEPKSEETGTSAEVEPKSEDTVE